MKRPGFTLIEFIIYIGIVAAVLTASVTITWRLINDQIKLAAIDAVDYAGSFVLNDMAYQGKRAASVNAGTVFDIHPGTLIFDFPAQPDITYDTYQKQITVGDTMVNISKLRRQAGTDPPEDMTSDGVNVTNFLVTDLSGSGPETVKINLSIEAVNPGGSRAYSAENTWSTTVTIRGL